MNIQQQRITIATACGWTFIWQDTDDWCGIEPEGTEERSEAHLPDYLNSLDAMHEAEKVLLAEGEIARKLYRHYLVSIVNGRLGEAYQPSSEEWGNSQLATAVQRAEAFLRTIGKWKE